MKACDKIYMKRRRSNVGEIGFVGDIVLTGRW